MPLQFPSWIRPEIFPGLPIRWYGLMYVVAFAITYLLFNWQVKKRDLGFSPDIIGNFFIAAILGLIIGARIFYVIFYDTSGMFRRAPWLAILPFDEQWRFVGYQGLSYHGGFIGAIMGSWIYSRRKKLDFLQWADMVTLGIPLGFTFGRLGNFINGELYGKVTTSPLGMIFPNAESFRTSEAWVRDIAGKVGMEISGSMINLPRHPSQLYEALFEGIILWLILWFVVRPRVPFKGFAIGAYLFGFGAFRFFVEYFREPDSGLGYVLKLGDPNASVNIYSTPWNFSMGQILCFLMMLGSTIFIVWRGIETRHVSDLPDSSAQRQGASASAGVDAFVQERAVRRREARKNRKKLTK